MCILMPDFLVDYIVNMPFLDFLAVVQYVGKRQAHLSDFIKFWWKNLCL